MAPSRFYAWAAAFALASAPLSTSAHPSGGGSAGHARSDAVDYLQHSRECKPIARVRRDEGGPLGRRQLTGTGEGGPSSGPSSTSSAAGYSCDANTCKLPTCQCASTSPPGGLSPNDTPQFITFTADDAVQSYTTNAVNSFLAQRKNPNGCAPKMTYFVSLNYTNYSMVTDWYVAGNEIADHTMYHVGNASALEIDGNLRALNSLSGIPLSAISGFRAPYLAYNRDTIQHLYDAGFTYDSSATSATPANASDTDAFWPYTLDNGFTNDCLMVDGICRGQLKLPGMWEIPMYAIFDQRQSEGVHLMDPWLDSGNPDDVFGWLQSTFLTHYNGNRQPFGLYTHPIHLATGYPGVSDPTVMINMVNRFLDWAQQMQNVWIVSNAQMLAWLRDPVPVAQLGNIREMGCTTPTVSDRICNGMYPNEVGLLQNCPFSDFPFTTCYGCPVESPSPSNPVPAQATPSGGGALRNRLPANCSTPFWDPIGNKCLCTSDSCQFTDQTRPIGPNGANLTGGGTGASSTSSAGAGQTSSVFTPFSGAGWGRSEAVVGSVWVGLALASAVTVLCSRR